MEIRIGLISDTHIPERWPEIPNRVRECFAGVDLILHAGDVGDLWVLDELSRLAPVVAVHGNDETDEALAALPYQQVISLNGQRILLCHSHQPDRAAELASRKSGDWQPKLQRLVDHAHRHRATINVFGHTHIPMALATKGVLLVNPGAVASGNAVSRQTVQSAAILRVASAGQASVEHIRIDGAGAPRVPLVDYTAGFGEALSQVSESIVSEQVEAAYRRARSAGVVVPRELQDAVLRVARRCWRRELALIDTPTLMYEVDEDERIGPELKAKCRTLLCGAEDSTESSGR